MPPFAKRRRPHSLAQECADRQMEMQRLAGMHPCAPPVARGLAATFLASPSASSDALLLLAEALERALFDAAFNGGGQAVEGDTRGLCDTLREAAPHYAAAREP